MYSIDSLSGCSWAKQLSFTTIQHILVVIPENYEMGFHLIFHKCQVWGYSYEIACSIVLTVYFLMSLNMNIIEG